MRPTHQCFYTDNLLAPQVELRLIDRDQLQPLDRLSQLPEQSHDRGTVARRSPCEP